MNKRASKEIIEIVESFGYNLLEEYMDRNYRRVVIVDRDGYKYDIQVSSLQIGRTPNFVDISNPFTLPNISLWLEKENKPFKLCENSVYNGAHKKIYFQCLKESCGEVFDMAWAHIYGYGCGCPFCSGRRVGRHNNIAYLRPDLAKEWDYEKNEKTPKEYTLSSRNRAYWICSECGHRWRAFIYSRIGSGCPCCAGKVVTNKNRLSSIYPKLSSEWHPTKNGDLKPSNVSCGSHRKVWWICSRCKSEWKAVIFGRSNGVGCPKCIQSKGEEKIYDFLVKNNLEFEPEFQLNDCRYKKQLYIDFYLTDWKIAIEYNGKHHYEPVRFSYSISEDRAKENLRLQKIKDKIKEKYCKDNSIELLVIPYWEFDNIEKILEETFLF